MSELSNFEIFVPKTPEEIERRDLRHEILALEWAVNPPGNEDFEEDTPLFDLPHIDDSQNGENYENEV